MMYARPHIKRVPQHQYRYVHTEVQNGENEKRV